MRGYVSMFLLALGLLFCGGPGVCLADYPVEYDYAAECEGSRSCIPLALDRDTRWSNSANSSVSVQHHFVYYPPQHIGGVLWFFDSGNLNCSGSCQGGWNPGCSGCDDGWSICLYPPIDRHYQLQMDARHPSSGTKNNWVCKDINSNTEGFLAYQKSWIGRCPDTGVEWNISAYSDQVKVAPLSSLDNFYRDTADLCGQYKWLYKHWSSVDCGCGYPVQSGLQKAGVSVTQARYCGVPFTAGEYMHIEPGRFYNVGTVADGDIGLELFEGAPGYDYWNGLGIFELISEQAGEGYVESYVSAGANTPDSDWHVEAFMHRMNPEWVNWFIGLKFDMASGDDFFVGWKRDGLAYCEGVWSGSDIFNLTDSLYSACSVEDVVRDSLAISMTLSSGIASFQVFSNTVFTEVGVREVQNVGPQLVASSYHDEYGMVKLGLDYISLEGGPHEPTPTPTTTPTVTPTETLTPTGTATATGTPTITSTLAATSEATSTTEATGTPAPTWTPVGTWTPGATWTPVSMTVNVSFTWPTETPTSVFTALVPSAPPPIDTCQVWWPEPDHENLFMDAEVTVCELACIGLPEVVGYLVQGEMFRMQVCFDYYYTSALWIFGDNYVGVLQAVGLGVLVLVLMGLFKK